MDAPTPIIEEESTPKEQESKNMTEDDKVYASNLDYIERQLKEEHEGAEGQPEAAILN